jgi:transcription initiation factor TFIIIB Brf1 subunit/transcription initiation factor TFIIB
VGGTPNKKEVAQGYRILLQHLGLRPPIPDPLSYVNRIALRLGLDSTVVSEAYKILDEASVRGVVVGKDPVGVAAAALYIASRKLNRSGQVWEGLREKEPRPLASRNSPSSTASRNSRTCLGSDFPK